MSADNARRLRSGLTEGLGLTPERAMFDRWLRDNGHCEDQHDDMLMPLQRSLNELMWGAWKAAALAERERIKARLLGMDDAAAGRHNYYAHAAWVLFDRKA